MHIIIDLLILFICLLGLFLLLYKYRYPGPCHIDTTLEKLRSDIIKVEPRAANLQFYPSNESYTEDKQKVFICMKDLEGNYYPYNMLMAVVLHEIAHAFSNVIDTEHTTDEFNDLHQEYIKKATLMGLYNPKEPLVSGYCPKKSS